MTRSKLLIATSVALLTAAASAALAQAVMPSVTAVPTTNNIGAPDGYFAARINIPGGKNVLVRCKADGTGCQTRVE